jgi:hypothetical protein
MMMNILGSLKNRIKNKSGGECVKLTVPAKHGNKRTVPVFHLKRLLALALAFLLVFGVVPFDMLTGMDWFSPVDVLAQGESENNIVYRDGVYKPGDNIDVTVDFDTQVNVNLPLDRVQNAAAAYGLRKLRTGYNGYAVRVRKGTGAGATFMDIGFVNGELDVNSLLNFSGSGDAFVHTWYDQSGNGRNAVQDTEGKQPRIVNNGVIDNINGKPAGRGLGGQTLVGPDVSIAPGTGGWHYSLVLADYGSINNAYYLDRNEAITGEPLAGIHTSSGKLAVQTRRDDGTALTGMSGNTTLPTNGTPFVVHYQRNRGLDYRMYLNGTLDASRIDTDGNITPQAPSLFGHNNDINHSTQRVNGAIGEVIIYPKALTDEERTAIERNQGAYFGINQPEEALRPVDKMTTAAAAYGLRKLRSSYDGVAIRVRRDSDNREQDIGFDKNGDLDVVALESFVGSGSGYVSIWYDQSGNGRHGVQGNAGNQPRIVNAGTIDLLDGKPSIQFDGIDDRFGLPSFSSKTINAVAKIHSAQTGFRGIAASNDGMLLSRQNVSENWGTWSAGERFANSTLTVDTPYVLTINNGTFYKNSSSDGTYPSTVGQGGHIGGYTDYASNNQCVAVYISEVTMFTSALSDTNRTAIEASQMGYYLNAQSNVIPPLDAVDRPAVAYGLRKLTEYYNGNAIRVRRDSDDAEKDIGFDAMGDLNTKALLDFVGSGSGYVTTWYDQSGNGRNAISTNPVYQPKIMNAGAILIQNGRPAIYADSSRFIVYADMGIASGQDRTALTVLSHYEDKTNSEFFGTSTQAMADINYHFPSGTYVSKRIRLRHLSGTDYNVVSAGGTVPFGVNQLSILSNNVANKTYVWNKGVNIIDTTAVYSNWAIGTNLGILWANYGDNTRSFKGYMSEFVLYPTALSDTNRQAIEASQMAYFGINQPSPTVRPLDAVGSAAAAYGLRRLDSSYTGSAIRVRRSSDNSERDIGFGYSGELDTNGLLEFVGTGDGFVTKWYDQSGNDRDAVQGMEDNQPRIVSGGKINVSNGKPTLKFTRDNKNVLLIPANAAFNTVTPNIFSTFDVSTYNGLAGIFSKYHTQDENSFIFRLDNESGTKLQFAAQGSLTSPIIFSLNTFMQATAYRVSGGTAYLRRNGNLEVSGALSMSAGSSGVRIGEDYAPDNTRFFNGNIGEIIFYNAERTDAQRQALEASQMAYFNIQRTKETEPSLTLNINGSSRQATYIRGSGSSSLTFRYTVQPGDEGIWSGDVTISDRITLNDGTMLNSVGQPVSLDLLDPGDTTKITINGASPVVKSITPPTNDKVYNTGDALDFAVKLNEPVNVNLPLDKVPNAAAAYGLRKLRSDYDGALVKIRHSVSGDLEDFYPDNTGVLSLNSMDKDGTTLEDWIGENNATVHTWYDQSGNGNTFTQTDPDKQPLVVLNGQGGKPVVRFDGTNDFLQGNSNAKKLVRNVGGFTVVATTKYGNPNDEEFVVMFSTNGTNSETRLALLGGSSGINANIRQQDGNLHVTTGNPKGSDYLVQSGIYNFAGDWMGVYRNGSLEGSTSLGGSHTTHDTDSYGVGIGARSNGSSERLQGDIGEIVMYRSALADTYRTAIEENQMRHFGIGEQEPPALPLDKVKGAAAAYGLRKLQESYDGPLVKVRKGLDADLRLEDFYPDSEGMLSINSKNANGVTLSTWLATVPAATDAFVHTWYDQSGNRRDATQTETANQPQVVSGGKIEMQNGRPSIYLNGSQNLAGTISFANSNISIFALAKYNSISSTQVVFGLGADGTNIGLGLNAGGYTNYFKWAEQPDARYSPSNSSFNVYSGVRGTSTKIYVNGVVGSVASTFNDFVPNPSFTIGKHVQSTRPFGMTGYVSELILHPSALSDTDRTAIEQSQMKYFNINRMEDHDPRLRVDIGGKIRYARYIEGSGTDTLTFRYALQPGDNAVDGVEVITSAGITGGVMMDMAGNLILRNIDVSGSSDIVVDTNKLILPADGVYKPGEDIEVTVDFGEPVNVNLPLDRVPNAAAAYSLRKLRTGYTGPAVRVRKGTSPSETFMDIGFVNGELDVTALLTFAGGGDAFVHTWYDQSGNGNNAVRGTEDNQPMIVSGGKVVTDNNKTSIQFDGGKTMTMNNVIVATDFSVHYVANPEQANGDAIIVGGNTGNVQLRMKNGGRPQLFFYDQSTSASSRLMASAALFSQASFVRRGSTVSFYSNGYDLGSGTAGNSIQIRKLNSWGSSDGGSRKQRTSEVIIYTSAISDPQRIAIERNQGSYFGINQPEAALRPMDKVSSAAAAYGLRKLRSSYDGFAIRVRRDSDNREQDIGFDKNGDLNLVALQSFVGSGSGFVSIWYDQSGNGRHAVQTTPGNQPRIVSGGKVEMQEGRPSIEFERANATYMNYDGSFFVKSPYSVLITEARGNSDSENYLLGGSSPHTNTTLHIGYRNNTTLTIDQYNNGVNATVAGYSTKELNQTSFITPQDASGRAIYRNGSEDLVSTTPGSDLLVSYPNPRIGMDRGKYYTGSVTEILMFASALSDTNRTAIEASQMGYYLNAQSNVIPPLDAVDRPAAAYGLRKLTEYYNGEAIRVRRDSDDEEKDIGFDAMGDLNTKSLMDFVGSGNGFVTTWYDQSGNGRHAWQGTQARQPRIVTNGIYQQDGIYFNNDHALYHNETFLFDSGKASGTMVGNIEGLSNRFIVGESLSTETVGGGALYSPYNQLNVSQEVNIGRARFFVRNDSGTTTEPRSATVEYDNTRKVYSFVDTGTNYKLYTDGKNVMDDEYTRPAGPYTFDTFGIGAIVRQTLSSQIRGNIKELILYTDTLSDTNRTAIEASQMAYFGINQPSPTVRPLDAVETTAAAAYGLRKLDSNYTGSAITVRRSMDNATRDIGFGHSGELDTNGLLEFIGASKPLDHVEDAGAAYSLRKLNSDFTGSAIRVRNEADAILDIGFNSMGSLDTVALLSHAGGGNATVETWYDQSGNERHATQTVEGNRPLIVSEGRLVTQNGRPAVEFNSSSENYLNYDGTFFANSPYSVFVAEARANNTANNWVLGGSTAEDNKNLSIGYYEGKSNLSHYNNSLLSDTLIFAGQTLVQSSYRSSATDRNIYRNGDLVASEWAVSLLSENNGAMMGKRVWNITTYYDGKISEIILYPEYLDDKQMKTIEASQGRYFGLEGMAEAYVTKWNDQSGNNRHAEQGSEGNQPKIVSGGKIEMENGRPTFALSGNQWMDVENAPNHATGLTVNSVGKTSAGFRLLQAGNGSGLTTINYAVDQRSLIIAGGYANSPLILESTDMLIFTGKWDGTYITNYKNGSIIAPASVINGTIVGDKIDPAENPVNATQTMRLFARNRPSGTSGVITGNISEIIIHPTALSDGERTAIEASQMNFFNLHRTKETEPSVTLNINGSPREATYLRGSGSQQITFRYTVQPGDEVATGIRLEPMMEAKGSTHKNNAGETVALGLSNTADTTNIIVNGASPLVSTFSIPIEGTYDEDSNLDFKFRMNEVVFVEESADGVDNPKIPLNIGGETRYAQYFEGSGTDTLTFRYTVQHGDQSGDGIDVSQSTIRGGVIKDSSGNLALLNVGLPDLLGIEVSSGKIEFILGYPTIDRISKFRFRLKAKSNEEGIAHYVVLSEGAATPSAIQIKEGKDVVNQPARAHGRIALGANEEGESSVSELDQNTTYNVYVVLEDERGRLRNSVVTLTAKTIDSYLYTGKAPGGDYNIQIEYLEEVSNDEIFGAGGKITQHVTPGGLEFNDTPDWIKFDYNGKVLYLPKSAIRSQITWDDIHKVDAVFGKEITVGNKKYRVRLIKGGASNELGSEWNDLFYGIHADTNAYGWNINFTNDDLNIGTGTGKTTWTQDEIITGRKVIRGFVDVTSFGTNSSFNYLREYGWRPILEEVE